MKKNILSTKTIVATALGAALFLVLFMLVKVPSPIPNTDIQFAYGISTFFGALFGPVAGALIAFIGHALNDFVVYGSPWWSWIIASGISGLFAGLAYFSFDLEKGEKPNKMFYIWNIVGHAVSWLFVAPLLDNLIYAEPINLLAFQGAGAFIINTISSLVVGYILCFAYASTRAKKGSLDKE